ncbi:MAG: DUF6531 domain-containing protein, partial [Acidobacteriota bacterium]
TTRPVPGEAIGSGPTGEPSLGDTTTASDMLRLGNLLLVGSATGRLLAIDASDHSEPGKLKLHAIRNGQDAQLRAFASDGHNRFFYNALAGATWAVKALRLEDVRQATADCTGQPGWAASLPCFDQAPGGVRIAYALGSDSGLLASEWLALQALPTGIPTDMEVLTQDETGKELELADFFTVYGGTGEELAKLEPDEEGIYTIPVKLKSTHMREQAGEAEPSLPPDTPVPDIPAWRRDPCSGEQGWDRYQRVSVDNLSTGQSWSADLENPWPPDGGGTGEHTLEGLRARRGDRLRVRYNLRALGYVALLGSGITVVDLNRSYRLPQVPGPPSGSQCGRRLGSVQGQDLELPECAYPGGTTANSGAVAGLALTSALAVHSVTGCESGQCRGEGSIDLYSPLLHIGAVHSGAPADDPAGLRPADAAACIREVAGARVQLRDVALANEVTWTDHWLRGTLDGDFAVRPDKQDAQPEDRESDLLFLSLGAPGIYVFDVSDRRLEQTDELEWSTLIGRLAFDGHSVFRLQVDPVRRLLFAGGFDREGQAVIDLWDLARINGAPGAKVEPAPLLSLEAPWTTNHLGIDASGTGLLYTFEPERGPLAVPFASPRFVFSGLYLPEQDPSRPPPPPGERPSAIQQITSAFVPLGVPVRVKYAKDKDQAKKERQEDERRASAAFKLRVALPGSFGEQLTARIESLRALPDERLLGEEKVGAALAPPGGPGWPDPFLDVTLQRIGTGSEEQGGEGLALTESGQLATVYNLYESRQTIVLLADPRAGKEYRLQDLPDESDVAGADSADETAGCRRCAWPSYLPDPKDDEPDGAELDSVKELLAGGPYLRAFLFAKGEDTPEAAKQATEDALAYFERQEDNYRAPIGTARLAAWADLVPSPIQASLAEPAQSSASWSPGEAGVGVSLVSGEASLAATDWSVPGRALAVTMDRTYRSDTLGYGPLGSAGWSGGLLAHLRELATTGEVEYHDGSGQVWRFYPRKKDTPKDTPSDDWEDDQAGSYFVPEGLYLRLEKLEGDQGWRLIGRQHDIARFDSKGRLIELSDRLRQNTLDRLAQGNTLSFTYDVFGQLAAIEDDLGRQYRLEYLDDPRAEDEGGDGKKYGLLEKLIDFADREVEYAFDEDRRLEKVKLPEVENPCDEYGEYSFTGEDRPTVEYRYDPTNGVTPDKEDETAILHGDFAKLRLEGFLQPGADVLRARFEYDSATGRIATLAFPDPDDQNTPGSGIEWKLEYPSESAHAGPATQATVQAPWDHEVEYTLDKGRATKIEEAGVAALAAGDATPALGDAIPTKTLTTSFQYEDDGRIKRTPRADGSETEHGYASGGDLLAKANLTTLTQRAGGAPRGPVSYAETVSSFTYSADNLIQQSTDGEGRAVSTALAPAGGGPVTAGYHAEGVLTDSTFDRFGRITASRTAGEAPAVSTLAFGPDERDKPGAGLLESVTAGGSTETLRYDEQGNVEERSTSYGSSSSLRHDAWDRVVEEMAGESSGALAPVDAHSQRAFDAAGRLVRERRYQTPIGWVETRYEYNARDQVKSVTQSGLAGPSPGGGLIEGTTSTEYDERGRPDRITSPAGIITTTAYDSAGRVASTQTGISGERQRGYDELGRLVYSSDGHDGYQRSRFDGWGRMYEEEHAAGALIERAYDRAGGLIRESAYADPGKTSLLQQMSFVPTSFGGIARSEELIAGGGSPDTALETASIYDGSGRIVQTRRGEAGHERLEQQITYEAGTGRTLATTTPAGSTTYGYASGAPWPDTITTIEAVTGGHPPINVAASLGHDALGRVIHENVADTATERVLDEAGNLLSLSTGSAGTTLSRVDSRALVIASTMPAIGRQVEHGFDADGRVLVTSVLREGGSQEVTSYAFDPSGRLSSRTRPGSPAESFGYNGDNTLATWTTRLTSTSGQQLVLSHAYDPANRLLS